MSGRVNISEDADSLDTSHATGTQGLCMLYMAATWVVVLGFSTYSVDFLDGLITLFVFGALVIVAALRRDSWSLFLYGISSFLIVAFLPLLIVAGFIFSVRIAEILMTVLPLMFALYTFAISYWCYKLHCLFERYSIRLLRRLPPVRFSLKALLVIASLVCFIATIVTLVEWNEVTVLSAVGIALLVISGLITWWYSHSLRYNTDSEFHNSHSL